MDCSSIIDDNSIRDNLEENLNSETEEEPLLLGSSDTETDESEEEKLSNRERLELFWAIFIVLMYMLVPILLK